MRAVARRSRCPPGRLAAWPIRRAERITLGYLGPPSRTSETNVAVSGWAKACGGLHATLSDPRGLVDGDGLAHVPWAA